MKTYILCIFSLLLILGCSTHQQVALREVETEEAETDSVSYELIVFDTGFEAWFMAYAKPATFHSQSYYENWNHQYVQAWNYRQMSPRYARLFDGPIDYDFQTDYGLEINHKLFYYFIYVENVLRIPLIPNGPRTY